MKKFQLLQLYDRSNHIVTVSWNLDNMKRSHKLVISLYS